MTEAAQSEAAKVRTEGTMVYRGGRYGIQVVHTKGGRWSDEAETAFLDHLAATCNVELSAKACGFSPQTVYRRRRTDPTFARRWDEALKQGYAALEALLARRAIEAFEDFAPDPSAAARIPQITVREALILLGHHRCNVEGGPRSRRQWARPKTLDEMRDSILRKLEAIAPTTKPD